MTSVCLENSGFGETSELERAVSELRRIIKEARVRWQEARARSGKAIYMFFFFYRFVDEELLRRIGLALWLLEVTRKVATCFLLQCVYGPWLSYWGGTPSSLGVARCFDSKLSRRGRRALPTSGLERLRLSHPSERSGLGILGKWEGVCLSEFLRPPNDYGAKRCLGRTNCRRSWRAPLLSWQGVLQNAS